MTHLSFSEARAAACSAARYRGWGRKATSTSKNSDSSDSDLSSPCVMEIAQGKSQHRDGETRCMGRQTGLSNQGVCDPKYM